MAENKNSPLKFPWLAVGIGAGLLGLGAIGKASGKD